MKNRYIIPVFVTDEGCPFKCIYCNQKKITGHEPPNDRENIKKHILEYLSFIKNKEKSIMISFYGGSFTGIEESKRRMYLETAYEFIKQGLVDELGFSTRPDYISDEILSTLRQYNVTTIELGAQSLVDNILTASSRGHSYDSVKNAVKKIKDHGFSCGIQLMPGLIGETDETIKETTKKTIELKPDLARIYPLLVLKETELQKMYDRGEYIPLSLEKAVEYSEYMLREFISNDIEVMRIGLQGSNEISLNEEIAAGPFHDSFGELVLSEYILKNVLSQINKYDRIDSVNIFIGKGMLSAAIGYKRMNIKVLNELLKTKNIRIIETKENRYYTKVEVN